MGVNGFSNRGANHDCVVPVGPSAIRSRLDKAKAANRAAQTLDTDVEELLDSSQDYWYIAAELPPIRVLRLYKPDIHRAESVEKLELVFGEHATTIDHSGSILEATKRVLSMAQRIDCVLVIGSLNVGAEHVT